MNLDKVREGMVFKNYRDLCKELGVEYKNGKGKNYHLIEFKRYFDYVRNGNKIIITLVRDVPLDKITRGYRNWDIENPNFIITKENWNKSGVYSIVLDNEIYIGSTIVGFKKRYVGHRQENNPLKTTMDMLKQGAIFNTIWVSENNESEEYIRAKEKEYINYYINKTRMNVVNTRINTWSNKTSKKIKYSNLKIDAVDYKRVLCFLEDNNIKYITKEKV